MLGATHACANPLTAHYGTTHGVAIAALLPHVVRWNWTAAEGLYRDLGGADLADRLAEMAAGAGLSGRLRDLGLPGGGAARAGRGSRGAVDRAVESAGVWCGWGAGDLSGGVLNSPI